MAENYEEDQYIGEILNIDSLIPAGNLEVFVETVLVVSFQCLEMPAEGCPGARSIQVGRHRYRIVLLSHLMAINAHPPPLSLSGLYLSTTCLCLPTSPSPC